MEGDAYCLWRSRKGKGQEIGGEGVLRLLWQGPTRKAPTFSLLPLLCDYPLLLKQNGIVAPILPLVPCRFDILLLPTRHPCEAPLIGSEHMAMAGGGGTSALGNLCSTIG